MISSSVTMAFLDSIGYWGYTKDFLEALFRNRNTEPIGLGVNGLQIFHYLTSGIIVLILGIFSFVNMPKKLEIHDSIEPKETNFSRIKRNYETTIKKKCYKCEALNYEESIFCKICDASLIFAEKIIDIEGKTVSHGIKYPVKKAGVSRLAVKEQNINTPTEKQIKANKTKSKAIKYKRQKKSKQLPQREEEALIEGVFNYLKKHRDTSVTRIARDLHYPIKNIDKALTELDRQGKIIINK